MSHEPEVRSDRTPPPEPASKAGRQETGAQSGDAVFPTFNAMPVALRRLAVRILFYPTLWWNQILNRLSPSRRWWDHVDPHVLLGALPIESMLSSLHAEGVRAVVNMCDEFPGPTGVYERMGIEQLYLPTIDFTPPTLADIERGVAFIEEHTNRGESVYVHCKAGRGRSATVVLCWLMQSRNLAPDEAQEALRRCRPHIATGLHLRREVEDFYEKLMARED